jgi:hypothetical protein
LKIFEHAINPFTAKVVNKRLLGRPPKSLFGTKAHKNKHLLIKIALLTWGVCNATDAQCIQYFQKHEKMIANQFSRSKVINCVGKLITRHWNAWHSERHCVFTGGGKRAKYIDLSFC